jgi:hypothetical protein
MEKICSKCRELKNIEYFAKAKKTKDGYSGHCKLCLKAYQENYILNNREKVLEKYKKSDLKRSKQKKEWRANHYIENKHKINETNKKYREENKEKLKELSRLRRLKNKNNQEMKDRSKKYKEKHKDKIKKYNKEYLKTYKKTYVKSHNSKIADKIRSRIYKVVKINKTKKYYSLIELLGCTVDFFIKYIESKFTNGMTWENHGVHGWHFDHIKPCSSFDLSDPEQQKLCFHYSNYQPLWATKEIAMSYGECKLYTGNLDKGKKLI